MPQRNKELDRKKQNRQTTGEAGTLCMHHWPRCNARTEQEVKTPAFSNHLFREYCCIVRSSRDIFVPQIPYSPEWIMTVFIFALIVPYLKSEAKPEGSGLLDPSP